MTQRSSNLAVPCDFSAEVIEDFAERCASVLGYEPGADLEPIITRLGGRIERSNNQELSSIFVVPGEPFIITLPSSMLPLRERFTIAHEIGHYCLHADVGQRALSANHDPAQENEKAEHEAHQFAVAFLMPKARVISAVEKFGSNLLALAAHFKVPAQVAADRLEALLPAAPDQEDLQTLPTETSLA